MRYNVQNKINFSPTITHKYDLYVKIKIKLNYFHFQCPFIMKLS